MSDLFSKKFIRNVHFPWQTIGEETIIVDPAQKSSFELDSVGSFIWNQLDGGKSLDEIALSICEDFEVTPELAREDLLSLSEDLIGNQLILEKR